MILISTNKVLEIILKMTNY